MVLNGEVITHPSMGLTCLPFMHTESYDWSQSAGTAGKAVVGQISTLCFSRIGPRVAYILFATSSVGTKLPLQSLVPFRQMSEHRWLTGRREYPGEPIVMHQIGVPDR